MQVLTQTPTSSVFDFPASVTLRTAADLRAELLALLRPSHAVTFDCSALAEADLSLVQLLVAFRKSADRLGMTVSLKEAASGAFAQLLIRSGFLTAPAGDPDHDDPFWLKGAHSHE